MHELENGAQKVFNGGKSIINEVKTANRERELANDKCLDGQPCNEEDLKKTFKNLKDEIGDWFNRIHGGSCVFDAQCMDSISYCSSKYFLKRCRSCRFRFSRRWDC